MPGPTIRWRLLLAFLGISAFAVIAALAALYSFAEVGRVLDRITRERVPGTVAALELSRQAERIVSAAPALLAVDTKGKLRDVSEAIATEVRQLEQLVANLGKGGLRPGALAQIEPAIEGLRRNLAALDAPGGADASTSRRAGRPGSTELSSTTIATMRLLAPGILVMDSKAAQWRRADGDVAADASARRCRDRCARRGDLRLSAAAEGADRGVGDQRDPAQGGGRPHALRAAAARLRARSARSPRSRRWRPTSRPGLGQRLRGAGRRAATPGGGHRQHPRRAAGGTRVSSPTPRASSPRTSPSRAS